MNVALITLTVLITIIFDLLVASSSVMPFRFIYDIAFMMIIFVVVYTSILLLRNKKISRNNSILVLPMLSFLLPVMIILNFKVVFYILWLGIPDIGFLNSNILIQGISGLLPLLDYLATITVNGILFYVIVNRKSDTYAYEIPTYVLGIIAIVTSLAVYCFHVGGMDGIRLGLSSFHIGICGIVIWLYHKQNIDEIHIKIAFSDILLTLLSVGIFMMIYIPHGIYCLFSDNAVVVDSALSITHRGSLQPYYIADVYNSPIGGFVSVVFTYLCGLDNVLLASTLPFLIAHIMLPYITYNFLREFVTDDVRVAIIGTVIALLMDGLAVILLPTYAGNLTLRPVIHFDISPATKSLHSSSILWMWFTPYKNMGTASATAICNMLNRRRITGLLLGGAFLGFSFINNPRQPFLAVLILVFLFGIRKLDLKEIITIFLATLVFLGPILPVTVFKTSKFLLFRIGLTAEETLTQTIYAYASLLVIPILLISLLAIVFLIRFTSNNISHVKRFTVGYVPEKNSHTKIIISEKKCDKHFSIAFLGMSIITLVYIILHAYRYPSFPFITSPTNYIILRYHILVPLIVIGFFGFKRNPRMLITLTTLALLTYLGTASMEGITTPFLINIAPPLIFVVMALPAFSTFVNSRKKITVAVVLLFVLLGVFSASLYSATVKTAKSESRYADLPPILHILLKENPKEEVFTPSWYNYYPRRTASMANLRLTSDPSCRLYIIHKPYTENMVIENLLNDSNIKVMYNGDAFILLENSTLRER